MVFKKPLFFGIAFLVFAVIQVWISYWSFHSFLEGDLLLGTSLFLFVPALALLMGFYFIWFRRQRKVAGNADSGAVMAELPEKEAGEK